MDATELCYLSISEMSSKFRLREVSPVEVTEAYLQRIEALEGKLGSYITVTADLARQQARQSEQEQSSGRFRGPLHGVPVALKDLYFTKGIRTTSGSHIFKDFVPSYDATAWERLREAGAVLLGKTNMHEFAFGPTGENPHYGTSRNPWNTNNLPGGSSSGSGTAMASGECAMAMGSDTGGSIRIPSSLCGTVGFKATYGRVSRFGLTPLAWSLDHAGPLTRTVEDAALVLQVIAGHDPRDSACSVRPVPDYTATLRQGVMGLRVGVPREHFWSPIDAEVEAGVRNAIAILQGLGAIVEEVSLPALAYTAASSRVIITSEALTYHKQILPGHANLYDPSVRLRLEPGLLINSQDYLSGQRVRALLNRQLNEVLQRVEVLAVPTTPVAATSIGQRQVRVGEATVGQYDALLQCTQPFNLSGLPTISLPCGFTSTGLPIGLQLAGRAFDEATVLRAAYAYQQATDWHRRRPPV